MTLRASIIIGTYNRAGQLKRALDSLIAQKLPAGTFEIIVVNDGSGDRTPEICAEFAAAHPFLRCVNHLENLGLAAARNSGIKEAGSNCLLFMDDDCEADPDWAENLLAALENHQIASGCIRSPRSPFFLFCHNISQFHPFLPGQQARELEFIAGANLGLRRPVWEAVGGFCRSRRCAEDMEFYLRARACGFKAWFCPSAVITHIPERCSLGSLLRYSARHARYTIRLRRDFAGILATPAVLRSSLLLFLAAPLIALRVTARIYLGNPQLRRAWAAAPFVFAAKWAWCIGAAAGLRQNDK